MTAKVCLLRFAPGVCELAGSTGCLYRFLKLFTWLRLGSDFLPLGMSQYLLLVVHYSISSIL